MESSVHSFKCSKCAGNMVFSPESRGLMCDSCGFIEPIDFSFAKDKKYDLLDYAALADKFNVGTHIFRCQNCGAEVIFESHHTSSQCAFCGTAKVFELEAEDNNSLVQPETIIPFIISKKRALELCNKWIKKRFFANRSFKRAFITKGLHGIYFPAYTYDSDTDSNYTARRGDYYYVTVPYTTTVNGKRVTRMRQERRIRWTNVSGRHNYAFNDVLIDSSENLIDSEFQKLLPFDLSVLTTYKKEFLAGFLAERYTVSPQDGWICCKKIIDDDLKRQIRSKIGGDEVADLRVNTAYNQPKIKQIYLPIWLSSFTFGKKVYRYMVNGQTGKIQGKYPLAILKIILLVLLFLGAVYLLYLFAPYFLEGNYNI